MIHSIYLSKSILDPHFEFYVYIYIRLKLLVAKTGDIGCVLAACQV